jgi:hypothetical protein
MAKKPSILDQEDAAANLAKVRADLHAATEKLEEADADIAAEARANDAPDPPPQENKRAPGVRVIPRYNDDGDIIWSENTLPDECPVKPLGVAGECCWFLNPLGEMREINMNGCGQGALQNLFGAHQRYLTKLWPQLSAKGEGPNTIFTPKGFHAHEAREALIHAAHKKGIFNSRDKVRGRGCWKDDDGKLVVHLGDAILVEKGAKRVAVPPGVIGEMVYPARPKSPRPIAGTAAQMHKLYERFCGRRWERGQYDALLLLGWMGTAVLSGALDWRPMVFILGDAASGKSTLQREVRNVLDGRVVSTVNATEAALRAIMGLDAMAVSFDEIEADQDDHGQAGKVMKLARYAASGDTQYRSNKDQGVNEYSLKGGMLFSAINVPKMRAQDKQRFCFLKCNPFLGTESFEQLPVREAKELGQVLAGRMVEGFVRWQATLDEYRTLLIEQGHSSRGADQFGALLAAADLLLYDEFNFDFAMNTCRALPRHGLVEYEDIEQNFAKYWKILLSAQPEVWRKFDFPSVGEQVGKWIKAVRGDLLPENDEAKYEKADDIRSKLERAGLTVVKDRKTKDLWLAIPNEHSRTKTLFNDTDLQDGGWQMALRHGPSWSKSNLKGIWRPRGAVIAGAQFQCTQIRLTAHHDFGDGTFRPLFAEAEIVEKEDEDGDE